MKKKRKVARNNAPKVARAPRRATRVDVRRRNPTAKRGKRADGRRFAPYTHVHIDESAGGGAFGRDTRTPQTFVFTRRPTGKRYEWGVGPRGFDHRLHEWIERHGARVNMTQPALIAKILQLTKQ